MEESAAPGCGEGRVRTWQKERRKSAEGTYPIPGDSTLVTVSPPKDPTSEPLSRWG